jgi:hypothetical protein
VTYAAEVVARPGVEGIELEACGWYGFDHLSAHDKTAGFALDDTRQYLFSLCFCGACHIAYRRAGIHPVELAGRVREALDSGRPDTIDELLGADLARSLGAVRNAIADRLRAQVVAAVRRAAPGATVALHASPRSHQSTAFTGVTASVAAAVVDRLVVSCWQGPDAVAETLGRAGGAPAESLRVPAESLRVRAEVSVVASLLAVSAMGGRPAELPAQAVRARAAGADGIRLYHAGLAGAADLAAIASIRRSFR